MLYTKRVVVYQDCTFIKSDRLQFSVHHDTSRQKIKNKIKKIARKQN